MPNEVDEFLGTVDESSQDFIENTDPFNTEETPVEEVKEVVEKPLPFHKDEKVMKFVEKQIKKALESQPKETQTFKQEVKEDEDDYHVRLIGNDTPEKVAMIREAKAREERLLQQAEERAFNRMSQREQETAEAERRAEEQLTNAIDDIEENFNVDLTSKDPVAKKTRVDFMNFVEKIAPKDNLGNIVDYPDMNSAFETFQEMRKSAPATNRAKDLASRSITRSSGVQLKPQDRITFDNIDSFIEQNFSK